MVKDKGADIEGSKVYYMEFEHGNTRLRIVACDIKDGIKRLQQVWDDLPKKYPNTSLHWMPGLRIKATGMNPNHGLLSIRGFQIGSVEFSD
jgi:hypothetical protein